MNPMSPLDASARRASLEAELSRPARLVDWNAGRPSAPAADADRMPPSAASPPVSSILHSNSPLLGDKLETDLSSSKESSRKLFYYNHESPSQVITDNHDFSIWLQTEGWLDQYHQAKNNNQSTQSLITSICNAWDGGVFNVALGVEPDVPWNDDELVDIARGIRRVLKLLRRMRYRPAVKRSREINGDVDTAVAVAAVRCQEFAEADPMQQQQPEQQIEEADVTRPKKRVKAVPVHPEDTTIIDQDNSNPLFNQSLDNGATQKTMPDLLLHFNYEPRGHCNDFNNSTFLRWLQSEGWVDQYCLTKSRTTQTAKSTIFNVHAVIDAWPGGFYDVIHRQRVSRPLNRSSPEYDQIVRKLRSALSLAKRRRIKNQATAATPEAGSHDAGGNHLKPDHGDNQPPNGVSKDRLLVEVFPSDINTRDSIMKKESISSPRASSFDSLTDSSRKLSNPKSPRGNTTDDKLSDSFSPSMVQDKENDANHGSSGESALTLDTNPKRVGILESSSSATINSSDDSERCVGDATEPMNGFFQHTAPYGQPMDGQVNHLGPTTALKETDSELAEAVGATFDGSVDDHTMAMPAHEDAMTSNGVQLTIIQPLPSNNSSARRRLLYNFPVGGDRRGSIGKNIAFYEWLLDSPEWFAKYRTAHRKEVALLVDSVISAWDGSFYDVLERKESEHPLDPSSEMYAKLRRCVNHLFHKLKARGKKQVKSLSKDESPSARKNSETLSFNRGGDEASRVTRARLARSGAGSDTSSPIVANNGKHVRPLRSTQRPAAQDISSKRVYGKVMIGAGYQCEVPPLRKRIFDGCWASSVGVDCVWNPWKAKQAKTSGQDIESFLQESKGMSLLGRTRKLDALNQSGYNVAAASELLSTTSIEDEELMTFPEEGMDDEDWELYDAILKTKQLAESHLYDWSAVV